MIFNKLKVLCDANVFNMILQTHDFALHILLGGRDNAFNELFLSFVGSAWSIRDNF